jgi:hypothetical protein
LKKKFYMISWKTKHFSLLTFFEILNFWNNDYLILPIFLPKPFIVHQSKSDTNNNKMFFLSLGEQEIKISICRRVLLFSFFM